MVKKITSSLFFLFLITTSFAQITFSVEVEHVLCNYAKLGSAGVVVTSSITPYTYLWSNGATTSSIENITNGSYDVTITDNNGNDTTATIIVQLLACEMTPEDVFTPNGDEINDAWFIQNYQYFTNARVLVYTRLGQKVFDQSGTYISWDGKDLFGVALPDASYYYVIFPDKDKDDNILKGVVSIVK